MKNPTVSLTQRGRNGDIFPGFQLTGTGVQGPLLALTSFSEALSGDMVFLFLASLL